LKMNKEYVPLILRIGLGIPFFWFGIDKFFNPIFWARFIPEYMKSLIPISINSFMYLQGTIEVLVGIFLIIGLFTRITSYLSSIILIVVIISVGFNNISLRDVGLLSISISLIYLNSGKLSIDNLRGKLKNPS
jgi:uncharacterized membrane protein YphA (DoxX/SURF4 family)